MHALNHSARWRRGSLFQENLGLDAGLLEDSPQRAFRHVSRMIGDGGVALRGRVVPDLMASRRLSVEFQAQGF